MDELRKAGDSCGARIDVVAQQRAGRPGRAALRQARRRHRLRDDGHQRGQGRRDRRRLRGRRAARHDARRRAHARRAFSSNNAGGVLGGISTGQDLTVSHRDQADQLDPHARAARSTSQGQATTVETSAATTPASASAPTPIAEAMLALVRDGPRAAPPRPVRRRARRGRRRFPRKRLERRAVGSAADGRSVRRRLVRLLRLRRIVGHLRAALVPEPRLLDLRDRCPDVAAERDAAVHAVRSGAGWPTTPAGASCCCGSPPAGRVRRLDRLLLRRPATPGSRRSRSRSSSAPPA